MASSKELFDKIKEHFDEFESNHQAHAEKGNKAACFRVSIHMCEIILLFTYF